MRNWLAGILAIIIFGSLLVPVAFHVFADEEKIPSPRQQMKLGIKAEDVECREGLVLMIRTTNGAASCVKSSTSIELSQAGWGEVIEVQIDNKSNEKELVLNEELTMGEIEPSEDNSNRTKIQLKEELSAGEIKMNDTETQETELFMVGGIDLSMASPIEGMETSPITIIEFGDYQCPKCKDWFSNEKPKVVSKHISKGTAKLYFVDFAWLGGDSDLAAQASHCANDQGKFFEYHSKLYNNQGGIEDGWANIEALQEFAIELKLNSETFNECLESGKYSARVSHNTQIGQSNGVQSTPYFFIVGPSGDVKKIVGPQPSIVFDAAINTLGY